MATTRNPGRIIVLVTDNDDLEENVRNSVKELEDTLADFPEAKIFAGAEVKHRSSSTAAKTVLDPILAAAWNPVLIIVDAAVRADTGDLVPGDGAAAIEFLNWIEKKLPDVPVLVAAPEASEDIQRKVLSRRNVSLWGVEQDKSTDADSGAIFAETLAGLALASTKPRRRITIDVRRTCARYRVSNGDYEYVSSGDIAYNELPTIEYLMRRLDKFSPLQNGVVALLWEDTLQGFGKNLFDVLIKDTVGPHVVEMLKTTPGVEDASGSEIDLRFEIDVRTPEYERLFKLPFELVNNYEYGNFLCSRVPMARRIRLNSNNDSRRNRSPLSPSPDGTPLKILFVKGNTRNTVTLARETVDGISRYPLPPLRKIQKELEILQEIAKAPGARRPASVTVMGDEDPPVVGLALRNLLEDRLSKEHFDIVHFAGHSVTLEDDGGTYLIFPDEGEGGMAVPIGDVAGWLNKGDGHLMVLSSCEGTSVKTAMETMKGGAEGVIGFRWEVDDALCVEYFNRFYRSYLKDGRSYSESFRDACREVYGDFNSLPTWASAVAVLRD
jgi:hypothetical protein